MNLEETPNSLAAKVPINLGETPRMDYVASGLPWFLVPSRCFHPSVKDGQRERHKNNGGDGGGGGGGSGSRSRRRSRSGSI